MIGIVTGTAFGMSEISAFQLGTSLSIPLFTSGAFRVEMGLGVASFTFPVEALLASIGVFLLLTIIPGFISYRVYRGAVRERFIEVR